jgi:hypothetical protein
MMTPFVFPTIPASSTASLLTQEQGVSTDRSIAHEGIAVSGRVPSVYWISALVLLLIAILAD